MIGIPFAWAHLKLAGIALWPIGEMISALKTRRSDTHAVADARRLAT